MGSGAKVWGKAPRSWGVFENFCVKSNLRRTLTFYRAMHFSAKRGIAIVCCPSVRLSVRLCVTFRYRDHIGWNSSKINSRPNSLRPLLPADPNIGYLVQREHPQN